MEDLPSVPTFSVTTRKKSDLGRYLRKRTGNRRASSLNESGSALHPEVMSSMRRIILFKQAAMLRILLALLCLFAASSGNAQESFDPETWLRRAEQRLSRVESYVAVFHKQERINGNLTKEETVLFKFKKPFKAYMKWIKEPYYGRESLYVEGCNNNLIKVHECGFLGLELNLDPRGSLVMKGSRHPITDSGIENVVNLIGRELRKGIRKGEISIGKQGVETIYGRNTRQIEIVFPESQARGYYCYRAVINIDAESELPIRVQIFDWDDRLVESYGYEAVALNAGLNDADFDPRNPAYGFRK